MAEEVNPNNTAVAVTEVTKIDGMTREPITIDQFWDENPLVMPWMEDELPKNRMWKDGLFNVCVGIFMLFIFVILSIISKLFPITYKPVVVLGFIMLIADSYILAKFNTRMARAQGKFIRAKMNAWRSRSR